MSDFWVFGYGSLMWRPGFPYAEAVPAMLAGAHRALCVYSFVHRGTPEHPGLVLGLDRGGACRGTGYRVLGGDRAAVTAYLRERELVTDVYREVVRPIRLRSGDTVPAIAYLVDRNHRQYAGVLPREKLLALVRDSRGRSGANRDYVISTVEHFRSIGIRDRTLEWIAEQLLGG